MNKKIRHTLLSLIFLMIFSLCLTANAVASENTVGTVSDIKASSKATEITLKWKRAKNAKGYRVSVKNGKKWKAVATVTGTTCKIDGLSSGKAYTYRIKAYGKNKSKRQWSKQAKEITVLTAPKKVSGFTATLKRKTATLKWEKVKGASGYVIYQYDNAKKKYIEIKRTASLKATVKNLSSGKTHKFAVKAYIKKNNKTALSALFAKTSVTVRPDNVKALRVTESTESSITLSWARVKGATAYALYNYNSKNGKWIPLTESSRDTTVTVGGLTESTSYIFSVKALKKVGKTTYYSNKYMQISGMTASNGASVSPSDVTVTLPSTEYDDIVISPSAVAVSLVVNSYAYGDGAIFIEVDPSNWDGDFVSVSKKITVSVNGKPLENKATCTIPSQKTGSIYEIKIAVPAQAVKPGDVIAFTIPKGMVKNQYGTQYNLSYSASVTV